MAKKFFIGNTELATSNDVANAVADKQDTLVSGTNIKTINQTSILGSGDIEISGGLTEVKASDIDSESATSGQVLMADGYGDASWQSVSSGSSNYNDLSNKPIVNQDLDDVGFTPVASTYYRHTGASGSNYVIGKIYYYDGTRYNAIDNKPVYVNIGNEPRDITDAQYNELTRDNAILVLENNSRYSYYIKSYDESDFIHFTSSRSNSTETYVYTARVKKTGLGGLHSVSYYNKRATEQKIFGINVLSLTATNGQVLTANGSGGASWQSVSSPSDYVISGTISSGDTIQDSTAIDKASNRQPLIINDKRYEYQESYTNLSSEVVVRYLNASLDGTLIKFTIAEINIDTSVITFIDNVVNDGMAYTTTAPSQANTNGLMKLVVLSSEPATKYAGWLYYITQ